MTPVNHRTNESAEGMCFVTGGTGNVGRHVVSGLLATGARVRVLTRNPEAASLPPEVDVVKGDLEATIGLEEYLDSVDTVFLLWRSFSAAAAPRFLQAAAKHAKRIVFLSSSAVRDGVEQSNPIGKVHADIEDLIQKSGLAWTFLRPGGFATNVLMWWGPQIRAGNVIRWPYGNASFAPIHERDIAAVAVRALTESGHHRAKYILTGPQAPTQIEQVAVLGDAIGRPLRFEEILPQTAREQMRLAMPPLIVEVLLETMAMLTTRPAPVTSTVQEITGLPARTFHRWAADHAADLQLASASAAASSLADAGVVAN